MMISQEILLMLIFNIATAGVILGTYAGTIKSIEKQITRLEEKQDKHNNLIERMVVVEQSCKSAHKRIDELEK